MNKTYRLYEVKLMNGIMMLQYMDMVFARNIVEAEFMFADKIKPGYEYQITTQG